MEDDLDSFLLDCGFFTDGKFNVCDYTSIDLEEVRKYINTLDKNWFEYIKVHENTTIEKVCYDYYETCDYYDLILMLNGRDMLYDMAYTSDVLIDSAEDNLKEYEFKMFGNDYESVYTKTRERLKDSIEDNLNKKNLGFLYIKIIKKNYINEVKRNITEIINTQKELFKLLDDLND